MILLCLYIEMCLFNMHKLRNYKSNLIPYKVMNMTYVFFQKEIKIFLTPIKQF